MSASRGSCFYRDSALCFQAGCVLIDDDEPVGPCCGDRVGNHPRAEGLAWRGAAILAGVAEVGYDRGHPRGAGPGGKRPAAQQFDDVVIDLWW